MGLTLAEYEAGQTEAKIRSGRTEIEWYACAECSEFYAVRKGSSRQTCRREQCKRAWNSRKVSEGIMARYRSDPAFRARMIEAVQNRRASKLGLEGVTARPNLLAWLYERDRGVCGICREPVTKLNGPMRPSVDHIIPLSKGGLHVAANLWLAHYRCNLEKHARLPDPEIVEVVRFAVWQAEGKIIELAGGRDSGASGPE